MEVEDTIPREAKDPREALITTVEEDTTVVIAMEVEFCGSLFMAMEVEDTIPREAKDPREALITTVEEDTTVVIAMEVEDTIPREAKDPREAHTARALTLALMDTCTMGAMMEDTTVVIAMEDM